MATLEVKNLHVAVDSSEILKGLNLSISEGEVHALMGPNGSGKSTLAYAIMGHPKYQIKSGEIVFKGKNIVELKPDERARLGLFLGFQYPVEIPGVTTFNFIWKAIQMQKSSGRNANFPTSVVEYKRELMNNASKLKMDGVFVYRQIGVGFSGGEKKRMEILQMSLLKPSIAILDEPDSGLDIDSLKLVADVVNSVRGPNIGILIITHYQRILNYIKPDFVHVMLDGKIVKSGGPDLVEKLEREGYSWLKEKESVN